MTNKNLLMNCFIITILFTFTIEIDKESIKGYFKAFLQKKVPNRVILDAITAIRYLTPAIYPGNLEHNIEAFPKHLTQINRYKGFIENQDSYYDMMYGQKTIDLSGCVVIAAYNALYDLTGEEFIDLPAMIDYFEKNGILLYGEIGTAPQSVEEYFNKLGFKTKSSFKREEYENIANEYDTFVLTKFNDIDDIYECIHTSCITKRDGKFYIHNNSYYGHNIQYNSIEDLLNRIDGGKAKDIVFLGIKKK